MAYAYESLNLMLVGRNKNKKLLARNTCAIRLPGPDGQPGNIAIRLHKTFILIYWPNGQVDLSSGGWRTITTRDRMNRCLPYGWRVGCDKGIWYLRQKSTQSCWVFEDGIAVSGSGITLRGQTFPRPKPFNADTLKAVAKLKKRVKEFAKLCASRIPLEPPGPGDCWICCADAQDHRQDRGHLESHMQEKYTVPRLVYNALKKYADAPMILSYTFTKLEEGRKPPDFVPKYVEKAVYRWILTAYGLEV